MFNTLWSLLSQFIPLIVTFLLAGASYWIAMQGEMNFFGLKNKSNTARIDYYIKDFRIQTEDFTTGKVSLLQGVQGDHYSTDDLWIIHLPSVQQFEVEGNKIQAVAKTARYQVQQNLITLMDQVLVQSVRNGEPTVLNTDKLWIDNLKNTVWTNSMVEATRPGQKFKAKGIILNESTGELQTMGTTQIRIEPKK